MPPGFCVRTTTYELVAEDTGLNPILDDLAKTRPDDTTRLAELAATERRQQGGARGRGDGRRAHSSRTTQGSPPRGAGRILAAAARALAGLQEIPKFCIGLLFARVRALLSPVGEELAEAGRLESVDDISSYPCPRRMRLWRARISDP